VEDFVRWVNVSVTCLQWHWCFDTAYVASNILWYQLCLGAWGSLVVKALRYWSDGPGIDSRRCHWGFFSVAPPHRRNHVPWGRLSPWKWVTGISPGVKAAGAYGWLPTTLVVPKVKKIRGLKLPGTPWATSACCGMTFTNYVFIRRAPHSNTHL